MTPQQIAEKLGLTFPKQEPGYLNLCIQTGNLLFTSGHVSDLKGKLGQGVTVEQGYQAARDCVVKILRSVYSAHGTLDGLRVIKLLGCVNSTLEFHEQHLVINGASDLLHEIYGKTTDGYHPAGSVTQQVTTSPAASASEPQGGFAVINPLDWRFFTDDFSLVRSLFAGWNARDL